MLDYAVEVEHFDKHLGLILQSLEEIGELDNTVIIVTSDHNMPFPRCKGQEYYNSNHIPMAVMWKNGIRHPGRQINEYISVIDLAPTILKVAGISEMQSGMQAITGRDFVDLLKDENTGIDRNYVMIGKERHDVGRPNDQGYPIRGLIREDFLYLKNFKPERWPAGDPETGYMNVDGSPTKTEILKARHNPKTKYLWQLSFGKRETDDAEGEKWAEFAQMMADRTVLNVKIAEAVKGGVVAFVNEVRAFIPASQLSTEYVEKLEDWQGKHVDAVIITVDPEKKRLVLSGREVEKEKKAAQRKERLAQFKAGDVVEGTVDNIKDYGAFVKLADGIDGLLHISQISTQRIKHPGAVLKEGQTVKVKILSIADGKISLSMKALIEQETEEEEHETFDYKETAAATTGLGDLLKGLKL